MSNKKNLILVTLLLAINILVKSQNNASLDSLFAEDIRAMKLSNPNLYILDAEMLSKVIAAYSNADLKSISIKYPKQARENGTSGIVYARFLIDTSGVVDNIKIIKGIGDGCSEEVLRVIEVAKVNKWKPIIIQGKKVTAYQKIFVKFVLL